MSQNVRNSLIDKEYQYISSSEAYEIEWSQLNLLAEEDSLDRIRQFAVGGLLNVSKFRSLYWSLLLGVVNGQIRSWVLQKSNNRVEYLRLKEIFYCNPHTSTDTDDPLSQSGNSTWNQYFCDQELRAVIKQDVLRTGVDFFRKPDIQTIMIDILFCYARKNPSICYRQGMHEILAPIIFVLYNDLQILEHIKETKPMVDEILIELLQMKYLEADAYSIFKVMMEKIVEPYYRIHGQAPSASGHFPAAAQPPIEQTADQPIAEIEILEQLNRIRENILAKHDPLLCEQLARLNIPLSIFGVRWLRLLYGREFSMPNLLLLWDAIFAENLNYDLVHYIFAAMLMHIRDKILRSDCNGALTYLMHYPSVDSTHILRQAQVMKNSTENASIRREKAAKTKKQAKTELPQITNKQTQSKQFMASNGLQPVPKQVLETSLNESFHDEKTIEALRMELQDTYKIMEISQMKLQQYLLTLKKHIRPKTPESILQVLDGMEELCSLLKTKQQRNLATTPIEPAIEANEIQKSITRAPVFVLNKPNKPTAKPDNGGGEAPNIGTYVIPDEKLNTSLEKIFLNSKEIEMYEFKHDNATADAVSDS